MVDVVIINPNERAGYQGLDELRAIQPPVWAGMLATHLRSDGKDVQIIDANARHLADDAIIQQVLDIHPREVIILPMGQNPSASTQNMPAAERLNMGLCQADQPGIIGGLHTAAFGHKPNPYALAPYVFDLGAALPRPLPVAWDLLPMDLYRAHNWHAFRYDSRKPYAAIYTSFGCPFNCSFCNINAMWPGKHRIRYRDVGEVITEIDWLLGSGVQHIKIADEIFVLDRERVAKICDGLIDRHIGFCLNMWAYARVDTVTPQLLQKMKRAGFNWLAYGFESASEKVRKGVGKGYTDQKAEDAIQMTRDAGISIIANYIFGLPDDDLASMQETAGHAIRHNFEFVNFYCAMAYPGSKLWEDSTQAREDFRDYRQMIASKHGNAMKPSVEWREYAQLGPHTRPLGSKHLAPQEVVEFRDRAFVEYFDRPEYKAMIEGKFGTPARAQIDLMLKHKPERQEQ